MKKKWMFFGIIFFCTTPVNAAFLASECCAMSSKALCTTLQQQMSSHVLNRRLQWLSQQKIDAKPHTAWKPRLQISDLRAAVPSQKTKTYEDFQLIVNYTTLRYTRDQEYGVHFDICLTHSPHQFLLEGALTTGNLRFENGLNVRDIYGGIDVNFSLIKNEVFPNDVLQHILKGSKKSEKLEKVLQNESDKTSKQLLWLKNVIQDTSILSNATIYNIMKV